MGDTPERFDTAAAAKGQHGNADESQHPPKAVRIGAGMIYVGAGFFLLVFGLGRFVAAVVLNWETGSPGAESMLGFIHPDVAGIVNIAVLAPVLALAWAARRGRSAARLALTIIAAPALIWELGRFFGPQLHWAIFPVIRSYQELARSVPGVHLPGPPEWAIVRIIVMTAYTATAIALFWLGGANVWYGRARGNR